MTKSKKQKPSAVSPDALLKRVREAFDKHVPMSEITTATAAMFARDGGWWGVLFADGLWTGRGRYEFESGCIGGYNRSAPDLVRIAALLDLVSGDDAAAFGKWFHEESQRQLIASDIARASRIAQDHGFTFTKKRKRHG